MRSRIFMTIVLLGLAVPSFAAEPADADSVLQSSDPTLTGDAAPDQVPTDYPEQPNFPRVAAPESGNIRPYSLPPHRFLAGSDLHPNPSLIDNSFRVDEQKKTVKVTDTQELYAYKDWAQERYFDVKFDGINKRFSAIEARQTDIDRRLALLEKGGAGEKK